uniref:Uncharacterized protein n=1 Tax=Leersia perrieri TaxID=77586 RepID=A0A0D9WWC2_9ORYZ
MAINKLLVLTPDGGDGDGDGDERGLRRHGGEDGIRRLLQDDQCIPPGDPCCNTYVCGINLIIATTNTERSLYGFVRVHASTSLCTDAEVAQRPERWLSHDHDGLTAVARWDGCRRTSSFFPMTHDLCRVCNATWGSPHATAAAMRRVGNEGGQSRGRYESDGDRRRGIKDISQGCGARRLGGSVKMIFGEWHMVRLANS